MAVSLVGVMEVTCVAGRMLVVRVDTLRPVPMKISMVSVLSISVYALKVSW